MKLVATLSVIVLCLAASPVCAQSDEDVVEGLQFSLFKTWYGRSGKHYEERLAASGRPLAEIETLLFEALDEFAYCVASSAHSTAVEENVPIDYVVELVDRHMCHLGNWRSDFGFDSVTLYREVVGCSKAFGSTLQAASKSADEP